MCCLPASSNAQPSIAISPKWISSLNLLFHLSFPTGHTHTTATDRYCTIELTEMNAKSIGLLGVSRFAFDPAVYASPSPFLAISFLLLLPIHTFDPNRFLSFVYICIYRYHTHSQSSKIISHAHGHWCWSRLFRCCV